MSQFIMCPHKLSYYHLFYGKFKMWNQILYLIHKHNRSEMVAVLGPFEALPYYIHTYLIHKIRYPGGEPIHILQNTTAQQHCRYALRNRAVQSITHACDITCPGRKERISDCLGRLCIYFHTPLAKCVLWVWNSSLTLGVSEQRSEESCGDGVKTDLRNRSHNCLR
jgi:hypothetical protein